MPITSEPSSIELRGLEYGVKHFQIESAQPLKEFATQVNFDTENSLDLLLMLGSIYVNDRRLTSSDFFLNTGDRLRLHTKPRRFSKVSLRPRIKFENSDFIVLDKPAGIPLHALTDNVCENVLSFLEAELEIQLFVTHRLDVETSGLVIIAKNKKAQKHINQLFADKKVVKKYRAWTSKLVTAGEYSHFMYPSPKAPKILSEVPKDNWLLCHLEVLSCHQVAAEKLQPLFGKDFSLVAFELEVRLITGRSQQIRAQLAFLGAPILGDVNYGGLKLEGNERKIALQSCSLEFEGHHFKI